MLGKEGRGFYEDFAVHPQLPILFAQSRELLALRRRQSRFALGAVSARLLDPEAKRRAGQIEIAGDSIDRPALVEDHPDRLCLELIRELPARTPACACCHCGHRICLSESVHALGSDLTSTRVLVWRFTLTERASGVYAGGAVVSTEARYLSLLWRGQERLDRRHASPVDWREVMAQLETVTETTDVAHGTVLCQLLVGTAPVSVCVTCVERLSIEALPADLARALDEVLFDASPAVVPAPPPWIGNPSTREH